MNKVIRIGGLKVSEGKRGLRTRDNVEVFSPVHGALAQDGCGDGTGVNRAALPHVCDAMIITVVLWTDALVTPQTILGVVEAPPPLIAYSITIKLLSFRAHSSIYIRVRKTTVCELAAFLDRSVGNVSDDDESDGAEGADDADDRILTNVRPT
jgi:hypothetical protein